MQFLFARFFAGFFAAFQDLQRKKAIHSKDYNMVKQGYKQTEIGVIPEDWEVKELGEIGTFKNGINKGAEDFGHGSPFVNLMDVFGRNIIDNTKSLGLVNTNNSEKDFYNLKSGDVIFIRSSVKPSGVGKTVLVDNDLYETVYSGFLIRFRNNTLSKNYKRFCFDAEYFRNNVIAGSTVSANTNINQDTLKALKLVFPKSLAEQEAIAAALSDADAWIESLEQLIAKKRLIKQGAMQTLLTPKEDWEVKKLGEVVKIAKSGGTPLSSNKLYYDGSIPFLSISDMTEQGKYLKWTSNSISQLGLENSASWIVPENSIIYSMYASVGFVSINKIKLATSQAVLNLILKEEYNLEFIYYILVSIQSSILKFVGEGTQKNLNAQSVKDFDLNIPSLSEQERIATILSDLDAELEALETQLGKARQIKQGMMQELLTGRTRLV